jgi:hypothetical protein
MWIGEFDAWVWLAEAAHQSHSVPPQDCLPPGWGKVPTELFGFCYMHNWYNTGPPTGFAIYSIKGIGTLLCDSLIFNMINVMVPRNPRVPVLMTAKQVYVRGIVEGLCNPRRFHMSHCLNTAFLALHQHASGWIWRRRLLLVPTFPKGIF